MRFRTKFAWVQFAGAVLWIGLSYSQIHKFKALTGIRSVYVVAGFFWLFLALSFLASYLFTWWDMNDAGLTQRRLWNIKTIPWSEITRIGPWQPGKKPIPTWVAVDYARAAPMSDRGELLLQPADRDALVRSLRTHAPQADYEIFS